MNPNYTTEAQPVVQPTPEIPPQPSVAGFASAQTPEASKPLFTITGPSEPIQQEAPVAAPPIPEQFLQHTGQPTTEATVTQAMAPNLGPDVATSAPESPLAPPTIQPGPEAIPAPAQPTFKVGAPLSAAATPGDRPWAAELPPKPVQEPIAEAQTVAQAMNPNLGPDVATSTQEAQAEAAFAIPHAPLNRFPDVVGGIDPTKENSETISHASKPVNAATESKPDASSPESGISIEMQKKLAGSIMSAQYLLEEMQKNPNPDIVAMAADVAKQTLINTATSNIISPEANNDSASWS